VASFRDLHILHFIAIIIICSFSLVPGNKALGGEPAYRTCVLEITNVPGKKVYLTVEIADTPEKQQLGLMHRTKLPANRGMLFIFSREEKLSFWMKNTCIPLSIAYFGNDMKITEILNMKPLDISVTYPSQYPVRYALEVNQGWFRENNISKNCSVVFNGCIRK
jgi:uncharacterized membrane protein (UPF0127 family)